MARILYQTLAGLVDATKRGYNHSDHIERLVHNTMPCGSGFDSGTKLDLDASSANKLVFTTAFHHMNDGGFYSGWTEHTITVTPSLVHGFDIKVSGRNRNDIKDYIGETFNNALTADVEFAEYQSVFNVMVVPVYMNGDLISWEAKVNNESAGFGELAIAEQICIKACKDGQALKHNA